MNDTDDKRDVVVVHDKDDRTGSPMGPIAAILAILILLALLYFILNGLGVFGGGQTNTQPNTNTPAPTIQTPNTKP